MKRILFFGGRDYADRGRVFQAVRAVFRKHGAFVLVHGACRGADSHAASAGARIPFVVVEAHPANWRPSGKGGPIDHGAGPRRNAKMLALGVDGAVGFPGGTGTADMARRLRDAGVPIWWPAGGDK